MPENQSGPPFKFFIDSVEYHSEQPHLTGAEVKNHLPAEKRSKNLYLEGHGDAHPFLISDETRISLDEGPKYFSTELKEPKYYYSVDGQKFESDVPSITGAEIRKKLSPDKRNYALYLEGQGNEPDKLIKDDTSVALEKHQQHRLYTVPPASFGGA